MSKKIKSILVGLVALLVLTGATLAVALWPQPTVENPASSQPTAAVKRLINEDTWLQTLDVRNADHSFTVEKVGEKIWKVKTLLDFSQRTTTLEVLVSTLTQFSPSELVEENVTDLGQYGLQEPVVTLDMTFESGKHYTLLLGDYTYNKKHFYTRLADSKDVYIVEVDKFEVLRGSAFGFLEPSIYPALSVDGDGNPNYPQINLLTIDRKDLETPMVFEQVDPDAPDTLNTFATLGLRMQSPVKAELISEPCFSTFFSCFGLSANEIVAVNPTEAELAAFGLKDPQASFHIRYGETSELRLLAGFGVDPDGEITDNLTDIVAYYVMREGTDLVYLVNRSSLPWVEIQPTRFISALAMVPSLVDLDGVTVKLDGTAYELDITIPEGSNGTDELEATVNGQEVDARQFKQYIQLLYFTGIQGINKSVVPTTEARAVFQYHFTSGREDKVEVFVEPDTTTVVSVNGNNSFLGRAIYIDKLKNEMAHLLAGEKVSSDW